LTGRDTRRNPRKRTFQAAQKKPVKSIKWKNRVLFYEGMMETPLCLELCADIQD
jgi:hypothetical protein